MKLSPYLAFNGNCEEAIRFYEDVLGGEIKGMMRFSEAPADAFPVSEEMKNQIMHCTLEFDGCTLFASDNAQSNAGNNFSLSINSDDEEQTVKIFDSLLIGGKVIMPFNEAFWGGKFGMLEDQFGIQWMMTTNH